MFNEVELQRNVVISESFSRHGSLVTRRCVITRLLEGLLDEKSTKDHGYFLAVTNLKSIGKVEVMNLGEVKFPVVFGCRTFIPIKGEILEGVVHHIFAYGVLLRCGPIKYAYLSAHKMPTYHYVSGENPMFLSEDLSRIQTNTIVRFQVIDVRWVENKVRDMRRDFAMLASIEGDSLGPISLCGSDEMDLQL